jgi:type IV pilus assembly protein PilY1
MKFTIIKPILLATTLLASLLSTVTLNAQTLAQEPLLSKTIAVRPNLTFIMDESGSMNWQCIYSKNTQASFDPRYRYGIAINCLQDDFDTTGTVPTLQAVDRRFASPDNNSLMYDPRKTYTTGYSETGTVNANSTEPFNSLVNGIITIGGIQYNTRAIYIAKAGFNVNTASAAALASAANYDSYFILPNDRFAFRKAGDLVPTPRTTVNPFDKPLTRTDCAGAKCTYAEELQNLRNWYTYNRTRLLAAKVGVSTAFTDLPDSFRMNYASLGEITRSAITFPNVTGSPLRAVNNYKDNINPFRNWLTNLTTANSVGTPLRQSLDIIGKNYESTANSGPWGNTPWNPGNEAATDHLSCRRSFAILTTDGQWNNGVVPIGSYSIANSTKDVDGTDGELIRHLNDTPTNPLRYQFKKQDNNPALADPRNIGKSDKTSGTGFINTLSDIALNYWARDLRIDLVNNVTDGKPTSPPFWQNLTTYSIGFGVNGTLTEPQLKTAKAGTSNWTEPEADRASAIDDLIHTAHNAGGEFIAVSDASQFSVALRNILLSISGEASSQAGVAASTTSLQSDSKKYVPGYVTGEWWGNVRSINLNKDTAAEVSIGWRVIEVDANNKPTGKTTIPSPLSRNVIVSTNNALKGVDFKFTNLNPNGLLAASGSPVSNKLINGFSEDQVNYIRGDDKNEGDKKPFRKRAAILGDIVNSRPAFVKNTSDPYSRYTKLPTSNGGGTTYTDYKKTKADRKEGVLFVGANDGMLHGFAENDGREVLAFIPKSVLGNLHLLTDKDYVLKHRFFVDGPMKEADAYIDAPSLSGSGTTKRWTNLVVGTTGAGAKSVFALDVTRPFNIQGKNVMWEVDNLNPDFSELGNVLADVETGVTPSGDWVAVFGNGYDSASGKASLFLVNLSTGAKIRELTAGPTITGNGLGGVELVRNANQQVIGAYAGDLKGNIWRFDLAGETAASWKNGQLLFTAAGPSGQAQSITAAPAVYARNDNLPGYIVVAGTGKLLTAADTVLTPIPAPESAYGLWDREPFGSATTITTISGRSDLVESKSTADTVSGFYNVTNVRAIDWSKDKGWFFDYTDLVGQRSIYPVTPLKTVVSIETVAPRAATGTCSIDGEIKSINYFINPYSGACKTDAQTLDTDGDLTFTSTDTNACAYTAIGDGSNTIIEIGDPPPPDDNGAEGADTLFSVNTTGQQLVNDGKPKKSTICDPATDAFQCNFRRDVRQIFIRK